MLTLAGDILEDLIGMPQIIFVIGGAIAIVAIICGTLTSMGVRRAKERTKREIAAYVAEGTIDADKAIAMLNADDGSGDD